MVSPVGLLSLAYICTKMNAIGNLQMGASVLYYLSLACACGFAAFGGTHKPVTYSERKRWCAALAHNQRMDWFDSNFRYHSIRGVREMRFTAYGSVVGA